ncbi:MAG: tetratricopeptide repeat protein [Deltaproteobacteria bacterium]|nr:tetratricopeptide repeat protein [Deltaproteobacteria bacterium]
MAINKNKVMEAAQKFVEKGQTDKAIKEYLKIVQDDPKDVRIWLKIGDLYAKKGAKSEATETYLKVAQFYGEQGFYLKAVAVYKQILKLDPRLVDVNMKLAELYRQLGLLSDAMQQYELVAAFYHREGRTKEALATIKELAELDPENVATRIKLAELYSKENMVKEAVGEFTRAADYLRSHNRMDDFIKVAERLVFHEPENHAVNRELATLYLKRNDPRRALQKLQTCFKADPRDAETLGLLAQAFQALDQKPKTVSVWKELARIHQENGNQAQALEIFRKILTLEPSDPDALAAVSGGTRRPTVPAAGASPGSVPPPAAAPPAPAPPPSAPSPYSVARPIAAPSAAAPIGASGLFSRVATPIGSGSMVRPAPSAPAPSHRIVEPLVPPVASQLPRQGGRFPSVSEPFADERQARRGVREAPPAIVRPPAAEQEVEYEAEFEDASESQVEALLDPATPQSAPQPEIDAEIGEAFATEQAPAVAKPMRDVAAVRKAGEIEVELEMEAEVTSGVDLIAVESDSAETHSEEIAKILTETDVYVKYGLHQKAVEHLKRVFDLDPRNIEAREKLKDIFSSQGRDSEAADELARLAELVAPSNPGRAAEYLRELFEIDPANPQGHAVAQRYRIEGKSFKTPAPGVGGQRGRSDVPGEASFEDDIELDTAVATPIPGDAAITAPGLASSVPVVAVESSQPDGALELDFAEISSSLPEAMRPIDADATPRPEDDDTAVRTHEDYAKLTGHSGGDDFVLDPADEALAESLGETTATGGAPHDEDDAGPKLEDDLDEADFFITQHLHAEARAILEELRTRYPENPLVLAKLRDLESREKAARGGGTGSRRATVSSHPARESSAPKVTSKRPAVIAKPLGEEDADTHYDLGLAYKEMGLIEEAVREFQLVMETPGRAVQCLLMIGLCYVERGMLSEAIGEFKKGLYVEGITERESLALYFEIGAAYESLRDIREALYYYEKVAKRDSHFRDVEKRVAELKARAASASGLANGNGAHGASVSHDEADAALDALLGGGSEDITTG